MTPNTPAKPGYQTTEFWLAAAATLVALVMASGAIPAGGPVAQGLALAAAALASMGYSASRALSKAAHAAATGDG